VAYPCRQQHGGVIRRAAPTCVGFLQGANIEPINHFNNKPGKVVFREPFIDRGGKQVAGLAVNVTRDLCLGCHADGNGLGPPSPVNTAPLNLQPDFFHRFFHQRRLAFDAQFQMAALGAN
jgi:hypothetical protein